MDYFPSSKPSCKGNNLSKAVNGNHKKNLNDFDDLLVDEKDSDSYEADCNFLRCKTKLAWILNIRKVTMECLKIEDSPKMVRGQTILQKKIQST